MAAFFKNFRVFISSFFCVRFTGKCFIDVLELLRFLRKIILFLFQTFTFLYYVFNFCSFYGVINLLFYIFFVFVYDFYLNGCVSLFLSKGIFFKATGKVNFWGVCLLVFDFCVSCWLILLIFIFSWLSNQCVGVIKYEYIGFYFHLS